MLAAALVVFREVLEAALIVSVIMAATKGVARRAFYIGGGILAGVAGAFVVAFFTGALAQSFSGNGQDVFNAGVLFLVVLLLTWHIVWMQRHGREMAFEMKQMGEAVRSGAKPIFVLATVVALAVLREGSEIVLFVEGLLASGHPAQVAGGFLIGLALGIAIALVMYWGFLKLPLGQLFASTNVLLMLIASGMAARGAGKLIQAGYLPSLQDPMWDTSAYLSDESLGGQFFGALFGYMSQPSLMQLIFYAVTLGIIYVLILVQKRAAHAPIKA